MTACFDCIKVGLDMNDHISFHVNPETRGSMPVHFFEADGGDIPPGTKATPRPADRPRELPPASSVLHGLQVFESQAS
jgi:hypothetical protein